MVRPLIINNRYSQVKWEPKKKNTKREGGGTVCTPRNDVAQLAQGKKSSKYEITIESLTDYSGKTDG